jgi:hypothetical protein
MGILNNNGVSVEKACIPLEKSMINYSIKKHMKGNTRKKLFPPQKAYRFLK